MLPILVKLGPLTLHTYGLLVASAFLVGWWRAQRNVRQLELDERLFEQLAWWAMVAGVLGGRFTYVAMNLPDYVSHPLDVVKIWQGGLVFYGGFFAASAAVAVCVRRYRRLHGLVHEDPVCVWRFGDAIAPAVALGHAIGRLGCFAAGCCYGKPTLWPWGVMFRHPESLAPRGIALHPTQLYEAIVNVAIFGLLQRRLRSSQRPGAIFGWYLGLYAVSRFTMEWWRGDDRGPVVSSLSPSQWIAIGCFLAALGLWRWLHRSPANPPSSPCYKGGDNGWVPG